MFGLRAEKTSTLATWNRRFQQSAAIKEVNNVPSNFTKIT